MSTHALPPIIYEDQYYMQITDLQNADWWGDGMWEIALSLLRSRNLVTPNVVLDARCGTGSMMDWDERALGAGEVHGIDVAAPAIERAQARPNRTGSVVEASGMDIPFSAPGGVARSHSLWAFGPGAGGPQ